jgi:hypothetical protein
MHGIVEVVAFFGFIATFIVALWAYRLGRPRSFPILILIALWPLILALFTGRELPPRWPGPYIFVGLTIAATIMGATASSLILRKKRKH